MSFVLSLFYYVGVTLHYYFNFLRIVIHQIFL